MTHRDGEAGQAAERAAHGGTDREQQRPWGELRRQAADLAGGDWWRRAGGPAVTVRSARTSARSSSARDAPGSVEIRLATGQHDTATVIHELAHALAGIHHAHDGTFRRANVDVAAVVGGQPAGDALLAAYAAFGLDVAERCWPPPARAVGSGFVMLP